MEPFEYAIPPGSLVLVTGANGYIASHIVNELLELGFKVRGTVREEKPWLDRFFEEKYGKGRFESIVVRAMEDDKAFALAAAGASGVIHVVRPGLHNRFLCNILLTSFKSCRPQMVVSPMSLTGLYQPSKTARFMLFRRLAKVQ